jgi:hypothetical protein
MKEVMKIRVVLSALFLIASSIACSLATMGSIAYGQAAPAGIATIGAPPSPLALDGVFHYALSASEIIQRGYYGPGDTTSSAVLSGDIAYTAKSTARPFSLIFAGGLILPNQSGQSVSTYQNVAVSQGYVTRQWVFNVMDSFSFLPESPTTGLSGIAGVGDLGVVPIQGPGAGPAGGVLTDSGNRVANTVSGSVERQISRATSISGSGSWSILHFLDSSTDGLDYTQTAGTVSLNQRIDARSSASVTAVYSVFDYTGPLSGPEEPNFQSKGINVTYQRLLSRTLSVSATVGPQWVSSSNSELIPSTLNVAINTSLTYSRKVTNASVFYSRGVNGGSGVLPGAFSNTIGFEAGRTYGRNWAASLSGAYTRTSGLTNLGGTSLLAPTNETYDTVYGGVQVTRRFGTNFSGYLAYTALDQTTNYSFGAPNALNGVSQTFGIGVTFSPRSTRLGQF